MIVESSSHIVGVTPVERGYSHAFPKGRSARQIIIHFQGPLSLQADACPCLTGLPVKIVLYSSAPTSTT